jgi:hypothetical protein
MSDHEHLHQIQSGLMADDCFPYVPGINCCDCGKFVGRDGTIEIEYFEMSNSIASVDGTCVRCVNKNAWNAENTGPSHAVT